MHILHAAPSPDRRPLHSAKPKRSLSPPQIPWYSWNTQHASAFPNGHCISTSFEVNTERAGLRCACCAAISSRVRRQPHQKAWPRASMVDRANTTTNNTDDPIVWIANGRQLQLSQGRAPACDAIDLRLGCPLAVATHLSLRRSSFSLLVQTHYSRCAFQFSPPSLLSDLLS
jgi:hypothetical protein